MAALRQNLNVTEREGDAYQWLRDHGYDETAVSEAEGWFRDRGWEVRVVERDRRDEMRALKGTWFPGFSHLFWVDLARLGVEGHLVENYASGTNEAEAVVRARERYGSEQT